MRFFLGAHSELLPVLGETWLALEGVAAACRPSVRTETAVKARPVDYVRWHFCFNHRDDLSQLAGAGATGLRNLKHIFGERFWTWA